MRVAVLLEQLLRPVPGGTGRYAREITAALAAPGPRRPGWQIRHRSRPGTATSPRRASPAWTGRTACRAARRLLAELWRRGLPPSVRGDRVHAPTPLAPPRRNGLVVAV